MNISKLIDTNLKIFTIVSSFWGVAIGLFAPFYFIYIQQMGGSIENYGIAVGIMLIANAITAYFAGKYSDRIGRKPLLIAVGYMFAILIFSYTLITELWQLYMLQIINGIATSMEQTMNTAFLGDLTLKHKRGSDVGRFNMVVGLFTAIGIIAGGYLVGSYGYHAVFYICAAIDLFSTTLLFWIKERKT